ncbi:Tlg2-vesicle protein [Basidiobolus ranarum]|uniref:Golgi apparatus membrane protein TVP38 n=1 Tax=Basidiobolus ranarum TaxID=34480 RepID=A0ABR2W0A0_9FUNG
MVSNRNKTSGSLSLFEEDSEGGSDYHDRYDRVSNSPILQKILAKWKLLLSIFVLNCLLITSLVLLSHYKDALIPKLEQLSQWIRDRGFLGGFVLTLMIACTGFPPIFGLTTLTTFSGFVYGFPLGFLPAFFGALLGGTGCFMLCRKYGHTYVRKVLTAHHVLARITQAIEKKGFKLFLLIRFAPYPYNVLNVTLAGTKIPLTQFFIVTGISLFKLLPQIYIGSQLINFADSITEHPSPLKIIGVIVVASLGVGLLVYLYWLSKRLVDEVVYEEEEQDGLVQHDQDSVWALESRSSDEV